MPTTPAIRRTRRPGRLPEHGLLPSTSTGLQRMTVGPVRLDVSVSYAVPRVGVPSAVSFGKWVAAALENRIREADLAIRIVGAKEARPQPALPRQGLRDQRPELPRRTAGWTAQGREAAAARRPRDLRPRGGARGQGTEEAPGRALRAPDRARCPAPARLGP